MRELTEKDFKGKSKFPIEIIKGYRKRIAQIKAAKSSADLRAVVSLHFEKLKSKEYQGKYSIRINQAYRLIFRIENDEISKLEIVCVEDLNNHYS